MGTTDTKEKDAFTPAEPGREHEWLQRLVGEWSYEAEAKMGPDDPPHRDAGTESVRSLGGLWVLAEGQGEMPDGNPARTLMTLGYDPERERFVGTWVGSMMTHMWVYDGTMDDAGGTLVLEAEGPDMTGGGGTARYRDAVAIEGDDRRTMTSSVLGDDGEWHEFMVARYRRTA
ncbi:MAG: DUF1579 domain-containing protein [Gemmatimonadota bacterium]